MTEHDSAVTPLLTPRDGIPSVVVDQEGLDQAVASLEQGGEFVAIDAERASGYRYSQRAYLIQIRREGGPIVLIDPIQCPDLSKVNETLKDCEWILHASTQDLACLREVGIDPKRMFDTELGARLAGCPRVGLGPLIESLLGFSLAKEHSAVDWSTRPLPDSWLGYAALDVELLVELRQSVAELLESQGKLAWAREEFDAILNAPAAKPRSEPWRRTSDIHQVKKPRNLGVVRQLWYARDELARSSDIAAGRILRDAAIVEAALKLPASTDELLAIAAFKSRAAFAHSSTWLEAIVQAGAIPESKLPEIAPKLNSLPPPRIWPQRAPEAYARLEAAKAAINALALEVNIPVENLLTPETLRRICWEPPALSTETEDLAEVVHFLADRGARQWQIQQTAPLISKALLAGSELRNT
ncbi:MAG TPA: HRDC domain-containing protein [Candidatus Nanopelagicaceae bacterium]|nr:HRDC domain-containing protein [Candidatus Nanopelagicaceae bacterium]